MLANDPLKINNVINTFLINANIFLYYSTRLNIYEWKEYHHINASITNRKMTYPFSPVCWILLIEKSFKIFAKQTRYVFKSEPPVLKW